MELDGQDVKMAKNIFNKLTVELSSIKAGNHYWEQISMMQELANKGFPPAKRFMHTVDISRAPEVVQKTWATRLNEGPQSTSFKGQRRQLQADPDSPHKTFGMRPHHLRGD